MFLIPIIGTHYCSARNCPSWLSEYGNIFRGVKAVSSSNHSTLVYKFPHHKVCTISELGHLLGGLLLENNQFEGTEYLLFFQ